MRASVLTTVLLLTTACSSTAPRPATTPTRTTSTARAEQPAADASKGKSNDKAKAPARGPRKLNGVPPGHYPKAGECRLWFEGRPPGQQPKAQSCASLKGKVPAGAFVLYGDRAYDADYDWAAEAKRDANAVPRTIVDILLKRS